VSTRPARAVLCAALLALAALYLGWFAGDRDRLAAWLVFALPPLLLAPLAWRGARARFWAAVLALGWFSHGVMSAWSHPGTRALALAEIALALLVIGCASGPGMAARFGRSKPPR
jgi:uncharacterized membrane protein